MTPPQRSKSDWVMEAIALTALVAGLGLIIYSWSQIPERQSPYFTFGSGRFGPKRVGTGTFDLGNGASPLQLLWSPRNALWAIAAINFLAYIGLTLAGQYQKLITIPDEMDHQSPHLRPLLFSMVIVAKTVLMLFSLYLVWAIVHVGTGQGTPISRQTLTIFVLAVPVPLILYTWVSYAFKQRRLGR